MHIIFQFSVDSIGYRTSFENQHYNGREHSAFGATPPISRYSTVHDIDFVEREVFSPRHDDIISYRDGNKVCIG